MAKIYDKDNNAFLHIGVPFNYTRGNPMPLDNTSVWTSKEAAEEYAKNSPVAYVGQSLVVVNQTTGAVESFVIGADSKLTQVATGSIGYEKLAKVTDYLFFMEYSDLDYTTAENFFKTRYPTFNRGVGIRTSDKFGCNADTPYDEAADFVVRVKATPLRRGSVAVCGGLVDLTPSVAASKEFHPKYKALPFCVRDGINDAGVAVCCTSVPADYGVTTSTNPGGVKIEAIMLPRVILDTYTSAHAAVAAISVLFDVCCSHGELHLLIADAAETYAVEFKDNQTVVTKLEKCPWITGFHVGGVTLNDDGTVTYTDSGISPHGNGIERWNSIAAAYSGLQTSFDIGKFLQGTVVGTGLYTDDTVIRYSDLAEGDLTIDKIVSAPAEFEVKMEEVRALFPTRSRSAGNTTSTSHTSVYDFSVKQLMVIAQENGIGRGLYFSIGREQPSAASYAASWELNSTDSSIDGTHLSPKVVSDKFGWSSDDNCRLEYGNGKWTLTTASGAAPLFAGGEETELVFDNYPDIGSVSVLFKHESNAAADRLVTAAELEGSGKGLGAEIAELFERLGDGFYRLTPDETFEQGKAYFTKSNNKFHVATAGVDYQVGDPIPAGTYYTKYTSENLSSRVYNLEQVKADKATTIAGYGITDAYIEGGEDAEVIHLGSKTLAAASRSYVDRSVTAESTRAKGVEDGLDNRLSTAETKLTTRIAAYVTGQTLNLTTGDIPALDIGG